MKTIDQLKDEVTRTTLPQRTKEIFYKVLDMADVATLSEEEQLSYESALKGYMDTMSCIDNAKQEGLAEGLERGRAEGKIEIARSMKSLGLDIATIEKCTGVFK